MVIRIGAKNEIVGVSSPASAAFMLALPVLFALVAGCVHSDGESDDQAVEEAVEQEYAGNESASAAEEANQERGTDEANASEEVAAMANSEPENANAASAQPDNSATNSEAAMPEAELLADDPFSDRPEVIAGDEGKDDADATPVQTSPQGEEAIAAPADTGIAPQATSPVVAGGPATLRRIHYDYKAKDGTLVIDLLTRGIPRYSVLQEINRAKQAELVLRLFNTATKRPVRRSIDASEFRSPVSFIRTRSNLGQGSIDVVLTMRDAVQPVLNASEGRLRLSYKIPDHWYGVQPGKRTKTAAAETAEPLVGQNLYPVFDDGSRRPERIEEDPARKSIPPQGRRWSKPGRIRLVAAGGAWLVGQDNGAAGNVASGNAAAGNAKTPVSNVEQNQAEISAIAASPGIDITGQDQAGVGTGSASRRINLDFRGAPLSEVIKAITDKSGVNFIYAGAVAAIPVTIQLQEIPWDLAFKSILDLNSLGLVKIAPTLYRVDLVANIAREREQIEAARAASQRLEPTRIMFLRLSYAQAGEVLGLVSEMLANDRARDPRIQLRAETRTNSIIAEAPARELAKVKALVERIDLQTPQVKIESRVVEVAKSFSNTFGISWGSPLFFDQSRGLGFGALPFPNFMRSDFAVEAGGTQSGTGQLNFLFGSINNSFNLDLHLRMSESEGLTETLQTNTVLVQNNTAASIGGGNSDVFILGSSAPGTAPQVLSVDYNMNVSVTPTVTADGAVRMTVSISSSSPTAAIAQGANGGRISRNINTVLLKRSGETAVIGGLNNRERTSGYIGIPILSKIPIIGALFRNNQKALTNRELLLMVTPTIMNAAQSAGDINGANFEDGDAGGSASSASPDKLDDAGAASEFRTDESIGKASKPVRAARNENSANNANSLGLEGTARAENEAASNQAEPASDEEALDSALDSLNNASEGGAGVNSARAGNSANNAVDANAESADNALGEGGE